MCTFHTLLNVTSTILDYVVLNGLLSIVDTLCEYPCRPSVCLSALSRSNGSMFFNSVFGISYRTFRPRSSSLVDPVGQRSRGLRSKVTIFFKCDPHVWHIILKVLLIPIQRYIIFGVLDHPLTLGAVGKVKHCICYNLRTD